MLGLIENGAVTDVLERASRVQLLTCDVDGVLTDGSLYYADDGSELRVFSVLDGLGLKMLRDHGITVAWITGSRAPSIMHRAKVLKVPYLFQDVEDKLRVWTQVSEKLGIPPERCAHIGDDLPDLDILTRCGLSVTVPHAPKALKSRSHYITELGGGRGAVRELCELILHAQGVLESSTAAFITSL